MPKLTDISLWKDPGFTEGSCEYPAIDSLGVLPTPDIDLTSQSFYQSKDTVFSELKIQRSYDDLYQMSYIKLTYRLGNPYLVSQEIYLTYKDLIVYAYIDSIEMLSDQSANPLTLIRFHIDYWRSFASSATYKYGCVKRRPRGSADPIQVCPYRYRTPGEFQALKYTGQGSDLLWMFLTYTNESSDNKVTDIRTAVIPLRTDDIDDHTYYSLDSGTTIHKSIKFKDVVYNTFDEKLGISPTSISSVYISREPPFEIDDDGGDGTSNTQNGCLWIKSQATAPERTTYNDTTKAISSIYIGTRYVTPREYYLNISYTDGSSDNNKSTGYLAGQPILGTISDKVRYKVNSGEYAQGYIYVRAIDDYIKEIIGQDKWDSLRANDTVTFTYSENFVTSYSVTVTTASLPDNYYINISLGTESQQQILTYNGNTFGSSYIVLTSRQSPVFTLAHQISADTGDISVGWNEDGSATETDDNSYLYTKTSYYYANSRSLSSAISTSDTREWVFTDMNGQPIGSFPWGISCKAYTARNIVTSTGGYLEYRFGGIDSHSQGTCFTVPLPQVDLSSNSWSDYVYSGQRDYDIESKRIANEQALISGITGALSSGVSSGVMGAIGGRRTETHSTTTTRDPNYVVNGKNIYLKDMVKTTARDITAVSKPTLGAAPAFGVQAGMGIAGSALEYGLNLYYNDRLQSAEDTLQANQLDNIVTYGTGWDWLHYGRYPGIISLVPDDYSLSRFNTYIENNGIECDEVSTSCDSLIKAAHGPLQVTDLIVGGNIPVQAKQAIKAILANGIRLIHSEATQ